MRPKKLEAYPESYWNLIQRAQQTPVVLTFDDYPRARSFRNDFYNFRKALRVRAKNDQDSYSWAADFADGLSIRLDEKDGQVLTIIQRKTLTGEELDMSEKGVPEDVIQRALGGVPPGED